jgi:hypothetical protein
LDLTLLAKVGHAPFGGPLGCIEEGQQGALGTKPLKFGHFALIVGGDYG